MALALSSRACLLGLALATDSGSEVSFVAGVGVGDVVGDALAQRRKLERAMDLGWIVWEFGSDGRRLFGGWLVARRVFLGEKEKERATREGPGQDGWMNLWRAGRIERKLEPEWQLEPERKLERLEGLEGLGRLDLEVVDGLPGRRCETRS